MKLFGHAAREHPVLPSFRNGFVGALLHDKLALQPAGLYRVGDSHISSAPLITISGST